MIFRKKRRMIDVGKLQRRGVVRIPKDNISRQTSRDGFVEFGNNKTEIPTNNSESSNTDFFGFMDSKKNLSEQSFSTEHDGYNKKEVDSKIIELDNKIYKLENRIELIEKKVGVNQPSNTNVGVMGW